MLVEKVSVRCIQRTLSTFFCVFVLAACGGGGGSSTPSANDQPNAPSQNDQGTQNALPVIDAPEVITLPSTGVALTIGVDVSDNDGDFVNVTWSLESSPSNGNLSIQYSASYSQWAQLSATTEGEYVVGVSASDGSDTSYKTIRVQVSSDAPEILGLSLKPEVLTAASYIIANIDNGAHVTAHYPELKYLWRLNDNAPVETTWENPPSELVNIIKRGDRLSVEVFATKGSNVVSARSPDVIVANALPRTDNIAINPYDAGAGDTLEVYVPYTEDADGDTISAAYQWLVNGNALSGRTETSLPAGIARAGDRVEVEVTLSDGTDSEVYTSYPLEVVNSLSQLNLQSPVTMNYGVASSFTVRFEDIDGENVQTQLVKAPDGFTYNAATSVASWAPTPASFTSHGTFLAQFSSSDDQTANVELHVRNTQTASAIAKSGIPIPGSDFELDIADFDGDGKAEILSTDSRELVFTLEFDGEAITQDWLYPFSVKPGESILRLWGFGADKSQILVVTAQGASLIESRTGLPKRLFDTLHEIGGAVYQDLDNDGIKDFLIVDSQGTMSKVNTQNWTLSEFGQKIDPPNWPADHYSIAVGNVDLDPALEIVVSTGHVIDGVSGNIEWAHFEPFGSLVTVGDVEGDGDNDIVAGDRWDNLTSYDAVEKTSIWSYAVNDYCGLRFQNIDNDPQDELFVGPCQHGVVGIYDGSSGSMLLQETIAGEGFNSGYRSFSFGDLDNDDIDEIVFSSGSTSSIADNMIVASLSTLGDQSPGAIATREPAQINGFRSIGWDTANISNPNAVFVLPKTEGRDDGQRIASLSVDNSFSLSHVLEYNWEGVDAGVVADDSSIREALVAASDGRINHVSLDSFSKTHLHTDLPSNRPYIEAEVKSISLGIDTDGRAKAVIAIDQLKLQVYDIANRQVEWTSGGLTGDTMVGAVAANKDSGFDIVAATLSELTLWRKEEGQYAKTNTVNINCFAIAYLGDSAESSIACLQYGRDYGSGSTVTLFDTELNQQAEFAFDFNITAISAVTSGELVIGTLQDAYPGAGYNEFEYNLRMISASSGSTIWESAPLHGSINEISVLNLPSGDSKMAVSTSKAMYILQ